MKRTDEIQSYIDTLEHEAYLIHCGLNVASTLMPPQLVYTANKAMLRKAKRRLDQAYHLKQTFPIGA